MTSPLATGAGPAPAPPLDDRLLLAELGTDVVIVGAGPAGAALAFLCASRGVRSVLVERHEDLAREFRGEGLQPSGRRCLELMGLAERFAAVPQIRLAGMRLGTARGSLRFPAPVSEEEGPVLVSQPGLLEMLVDEASAYPDFRLLKGLAVTGLLREEGRVVGVETDGYPTELRARIVVGADGRASVVRRATDLAVHSLDQEFDILWMRADLGDFLPDRRTGHWDYAGDTPLVVFPSPAGGHQIGAILDKGAYKEMDRQERIRFLTEHASPSLSRAIEASLPPLAGPVALKVECDRLECWSEPGVLLIGDAAHTMSPVGGQGINMALRDAIVAANHLVPLLLAAAGDREIDAAAVAVGEERLPEIRAVQEIQTREAPRLLRGSRTLLALAPLLARMPFLVRWLTRRRIAMRTGFSELELRV